MYLGKWQETDVAVKVLIEKQDLAPNNEVQPQDPATQEPWSDSADDNPPQQGGEKRRTASGLIGLTDADASLTGQSTLAGRSDPEFSREDSEAFKTLEREVHVILPPHPHLCMQWGVKLLQPDHPSMSARCVISIPSPASCPSWQV